MLNAALIVVDVIAALFLIVTILLHSGRGSGLSDMFGGGSTLSGGTVLERRLDKITVITAIVFGTVTFYLTWKWQ
jgi:preprotein translocase subunit SecG